jgi:hypothetical protein
MEFPNTLSKLNRAKRLISLMTEHQTRADDFDALLDAALSMLREVTWILKKEVAHKPQRAREWYAREAELMRPPQNSALPWLRDLRNASTKERPTQVGTMTHIKNIRIERSEPGKAFAITGRGEPVWITKDSDGKEIRTHASEFDRQIAMKHFIVDSNIPRLLTLGGEDLTGADALTIVRAYAEYLSNMLDRAEALAVGIGQ